MSTDEAIAVAIAMGKLRQLAHRHGDGVVGVVKAFRELSMQGTHAHPDHGGDATQWRRLVLARDRLVAGMNAVEVALRSIPDAEFINEEGVH